MAEKKIICIMTQKGGAGKTTIAVNLGAAIASQYPHLRIAIGDADPQGSSYIWVNRGKGAAGISVTRIASDGEGKTLKADLNAIDADLIVIDLPPSLEAVSLRCAIRSHLILIPALPSIIDLAATQGAVAIVKEAIELIPDKKFLLVPNRVQNNTSTGRELRGELTTWGPVSETTLCQRIAFSEAAVYGVGVTQYAPESPAAQEIGLLAEEVAQMLGLV